MCATCRFIVFSACERALDDTRALVFCVCVCVCVSDGFHPLKFTCKIYLTDD
jgi:hypothetical protein